VHIYILLYISIYIYVYCITSKNKTSWSQVVYDDSIVRRSGYGASRTALCGGKYLGTVYH